MESAITAEMRTFVVASQATLAAKPFVITCGY
jgi:hypothetical protein